MRSMVLGLLIVSCWAATNAQGRTNRVLFINNTKPEPYVSVPRSAAIEPASNLTVEAWVKPLRVLSGLLDYYVVTKRLTEHSYPHNSYIMGCNVPNSSSNWFAQVTTIPSTSCITPETNVVGFAQWTHIAMTYDGLQLRYYVNGTLVSTTNGNGAIQYSALSLRIGKAQLDQSNDGYYGYIDEVRVWNRVLSQAELQSNLYSELRGNEANLVGYWNFNDGTAADASVQHNNGTFVSGATSALDDVPWSGPQPVADIRVSAVDIEWSSATSKSYQVQFSESMVNPVWSNLGSVYVGTGSNIYHMDVIRSMPLRYYRVLEY